MATEIMKNKKLYQCVGENFGFPCNIGYCGDVFSLDKWIEILWKSKCESAKEYFDGFSNVEILDYIYRNMGKRLKPIK